MKKNNTLIVPALIILTVIFADLFIRKNYILQYSFTDSFIYGLSFFYEFSFLLIFFFIFEQIILQSIALIVYFFTIAASYAFWNYFKTLPGINTFSYLFLSPANSFGIVRDGFNPVPFIGSLAAIVLLIFLQLKLKRIKPEKTPRFIKWMIFAFFLILTLVLNNNLKLKDNITLPFTNAVFSFKHGYSDYLKTGKLSHIGNRTFNLPEFLKVKSDGYNVIYIMNESLSPYYFNEYGSKYNTDSLLTSFFKAGGLPGKQYVFKHAYTNSTVTAVSVPFAMGGINPSQGKHLLSSTPLMYVLRHNKR